MLRLQSVTLITNMEGGKTNYWNGPHSPERVFWLDFIIKDLGSGGVGGGGGAYRVIVNSC